MYEIQEESIKRRDRPGMQKDVAGSGRRVSVSDPGNGSHAGSYPHACGLSAAVLYFRYDQDHEREKALSTGTIPETFVFAGKVEEDADSIQLWCGDTKTEYPGPPDNGDLSSGSRLPDRDLRTGLGRIEEDPGDKKAF